MFNNIHCKSKIYVCKIIILPLLINNSWQRKNYGKNDRKVPMSCASLVRWDSCFPLFLPPRGGGFDVQQRSIDRSGLPLGSSGGSENETEF